MAVGYSCNVWRAAYAKELFALQTCSFFSSLITARGYIQNQQTLGLRVSSLAHGNGHWFVVMSKGGVMPTSLQGIETSPNVSDFVLSLQQVWWESSVVVNRFLNPKRRSTTNLRNFAACSYDTITLSRYGWNHLKHAK